MRVHEVTARIGVPKSAADMDETVWTLLMLAVTMCYARNEELASKMYVPPPGQMEPDENGMIGGMNTTMMLGAVEEMLQVIERDLQVDLSDCRRDRP